MGTNTTSIPATLDDDSNSLFIGAYNAASYWFGGYICNVGIWSAALTQAQIKSIMWKNYAGLASTETTNLVSWWNLDETVGDSTHVEDLVDTSLGTELLTATGWDTDDYWGLSDGILTYTDTASGRSGLAAAELTNGTGLVTGKTYKLQYTVGGLSSGTANIRIDDETGNEMIAQENQSNGSYTRYFTAVADNNAEGMDFVGIDSSGSSFTISDYSLKEVQGNIGELK